MGLKVYRPTSPGSRFSSVPDYSELDSKRPHKKLVFILPKRSGRNSTGKVTVRHQGGREKRFYREIDWKRNKRNIAGIVETLEYDPNRSANIALIKYEDGERRYILSPDNVTVGTKIMASENAPLTSGNALPLKAIPVGTLIHAVEIFPGKGAQVARGAGVAAVVTGFEESHALIKLPSGEIKRFNPESYATVGQVGNTDWKNVQWGKAGRKRHLGIRPTVRGTAQNPRSHPHGGGEGRSGEGMNPKTPWGKPARGKKTRSKFKFSNYLLVQRRK
ncbi:50S ribosomal protein L2 [Candidatus Amesbacteria bacterium RIFCSPHIGHO2_02_FULL_47_9]|uniref:Large ribosomal subunit protein uL2 n=2 Tax=Microgenomates group TaxID=1794810 RepID=A0A0H4TD93_9BACT|nr:50S ribosomal protein L2 [uncultured Microgenomates bacterium Rifle_16ft_4_minimus_5815]OGC93162.1 MAG: 50S ribosomal protein L2 [Candidatus Amesbacteria bacterium RIFCSPHIGHO2_01_FULL_48_32b]OGD05209.1 MAG: 50S ribosomal protein L2 [Candidatus Amesbacteria bacterium RIFCSPHIGHO2_02_FULL_47_9]OGD07571.1 MAG: 50S ribosomal protein L2 [Candidatus Amesbacteria bacterium RIFCSPLOWO2_01_FULL_49_25]